MDYATFNLVLPLVGFIVGMLIGMTGIGGGALMTPILVLAFGVPPSVAVGTDLVYAAVTKFAGVWVHHRHGTIRWRIVRRLAAGSIPAALVSIVFLREVESLGVNYERFVTLVLSLALVLTSAVLVFKSRGRSVDESDGRSSVKRAMRRHRKVLTVLAGALVGVLVSLSSVGAGVLGAAMLLFLYPHLPISAIAGTDLAYAVPLAAIAGVGHWQIGHVDYGLLAALLAGALPGTYLGGRLGTRLPEHVVRPVLAACLFAVGIRFAL